jgi:hypothetical protein
MGLKRFFQRLSYLAFRRGFDFHQDGRAWILETSWIVIVFRPPGREL